MIINTNVSALSSARLLSESSSALSKVLARLSSGVKIVSPEDDAAGLAVSMRFEAQINRLAGAKSNVGNAISLTQTQDGFLAKVAKSLDRMSELSLLALDVTKSDNDRSLYDAEFQKLDDYISNVADKEFNGVSLFSGTALSVTEDSEGNAFVMNAVDLTATEYSDLNSEDITTTANAATALAAVKSAITKLAEDRANLGANIARLRYTSDQLGALRENLVAANSRIKDIDVAETTTQLARFNILVQAGTMMVAQANATPQSALRLLA